MKIANRRNDKGFGAKMKKWANRIFLLFVLGYASFWIYTSYRGGLFSLPKLPYGAYFLSFENGLRAIVLDAEGKDQTFDDAPRFLRSLSIANRDRKYLGIPIDVQPWFKDAWSWCKSPTAEEIVELERMPDDFKRTVENARFEAVCKIEVDGSDVVRGLIFSVPRL